MECDELPYGRRFPLTLNGVVYKIYVWLVILYESEALCLEKRRYIETGIEIHDESIV